MIWWILLGILVLLFLLPLGVRVLYDSGGARVLVLVGPFSITVFPTKRKEKKPEPEKTHETETPPEPARQEKTPLPEAPKPPAKPAPPEPRKEPAGGSLTDFLPLVELALKMVGDLFCKTQHIDVLYLKLTLAGDDPADLGINYGKAWAALGVLWPRIDDLLTVKKRDIQIGCDFEGSETLVNARVDLTVTLARIFGLLLGYGARMGWRFFRIMMKRKKAAEKPAETK